MKKGELRRFGLLTAIAFVFVLPAQAQQDQEEQEAGPGLMEEITVTAR